MPAMALVAGAARSYERISCRVLIGAPAPRKYPLERMQWVAALERGNQNRYLMTSP